MPVGGVAKPFRQHCVTWRGQPHPREWIALVTELVETLAPEIVRLGIATTAELDAAALGERTRHEVESNGSLVLGRYEIGAWARR